MNDEKIEEKRENNEGNLFNVVGMHMNGLSQMNLNDLIVLSRDYDIINIQLISDALTINIGQNKSRRQIKRNNNAPDIISKMIECELINLDVPQKQYDQITKTVFICMYMC